VSQTSSQPEHSSNEAGHVDGSDNPIDQNQPASGIPPYGLVAAIAVSAVLFWVAVQPAIDLDLPWHIEIGREILSGVWPGEAARGWSFADVPDTWVSTQWVAEVLFAWLRDTFGWSAMVWYRYLTTVAILAVAAVVILRGRPVRAATAPYVLAVLPLLTFAQERTAQLTLLMAPLVGAALLRAIRSGTLPPWWTVPVVVVPWANFHGGWVIVPLALLLVIVGRTLDHGYRDPAVRASAIMLGLSLIAASLTPAGPINVLTLWRFGGLAEVISEWHRVTPLNALGLPVVILGGLLAWAWARGAERPPRSELLVGACLVVFSLFAYRNVTIGLLMLAPLVADRLTLSFRAGPVPTMRDAGTRLSLGVAAVALIATAALVPSTQFYPSDHVPDRLMEQVRALPGTVRLLNGYNESGAALYWGEPRRILLAIDGRADRYGPEVISEYIDMMRADKGWEKTFDRYNPDVALVPTDDHIVSMLKLTRGWKEVGAQGAWVLLVPPGTSVIPTPPPRATPDSPNAR